MKPVIISVGNIAMGGTGKTPFTVFLAKRYMSAGEKVAILSLGYKGKLGYGANIISDGNKIFHSPPYAADEPYMMASALSGENGAVVITGKDRLASYTLATERFAPTVFLLDDGFQHHSLPKDVDIVLLDYAKPFSTGFPFPFGYLREFPSALRRADIIVFTRALAATLPEGAEKHCQGKQIFYCANKYMAFSAKLPLDYISGKKVWLMSAIAGPVQFGKQIQQLGAVVAGHSVFKDHHFYTEKEIKKVITCAENTGSEILMTTQKDFVKIPEEYKHLFIYPDMSVQMLNQGLFDAIDNIRR
jgi:tetraacyldisaccharide 4'-kinase